MSWGNEKEKAERGVTQAGSTAYEQSKMTPEEQAQYSQSFQTGDLLTQLERYRAGLGLMPAGYQTPEQQYQQGGPLAQSYYQQTLAGTQDPYAAWESTLGPQMQLAQDQINRYYGNRGFSPKGTGMGIESMGRAGVELAIQEAQNRMNFRNQELQRGGNLADYTNQLSQQNVSNLQNLYGQQQGYGETAMNRQASAAWNNAQYQAYPSQAALGDVYGRQAAMYALPGQVVGAIGQLGGGSSGNPAYQYQPAQMAQTSNVATTAGGGYSDLSQLRSGANQLDPTKFKLSNQLGIPY